MCAHDDSAGMTALPGAAWTGLQHTPNSGKRTFLRQEGAREMADARLPIRAHHPHTRQTDKPLSCRVSGGVLAHGQAPSTFPPSPTLSSSLCHPHIRQHILHIQEHHTCITPHRFSQSESSHKQNRNHCSKTSCRKAKQQRITQGACWCTTHAPCSTQKKWFKGVQTSRFPRKSNLSTQ
jgi:hypothetical protein